MNEIHTGVFFHELFSEEVWHIINDKFRNYPEIMKSELNLPNVKLIEPKPVNDDLLLKIHTPRFLKDLKNQWYCKGAYLTVGGCVEASEMIMKGELRNALVFGVSAGHHAERDSAYIKRYLTNLLGYKEVNTIYEHNVTQGQLSKIFWTKENFRDQLYN